MESHVEVKEESEGWSQHQDQFKVEAETQEIEPHNLLKISLGDGDGTAEFETVETGTEGKVEYALPKESLELNSQQLLLPQPAPEFELELEFEEEPESILPDPGPGSPQFFPCSSASASVSVASPSQVEIQTNKIPEAEKASGGEIEIVEIGSSDEDQPASGSTNTDDFRCHICKKSFSGKKGLRYHIQCVHAEKPFLCKVCPKKFGSQAHLTRHSKTHSEDDSTERRYWCQKCLGSFPSKKVLTAHEKMHERRPQKTSRAKSRGFPSPMAFIYTQSEAHTCVTCYRKYKTKQSLLNHVLKEHILNDNDAKALSKSPSKSDSSESKKNNPGKFKCSGPGCSESFPEELGFALHLRTCPKITNGSTSGINTDPSSLKCDVEMSEVEIQDN